MNGNCHEPCRLETCCACCEEKHDCEYACSTCISDKADSDNRTSFSISSTDTNSKEE